MNLSVIPAPAGTKGFDCNSTLSDADAAAFVAAGYRFAIRYLPRVTAHAHDLSAGEAIRMLSAGLGLMAVQHVESETGWVPTAQKGIDYGTVAAHHASSCGLPPLTMCWLDLEGVTAGTPAEDVIQYCNRWRDVVSAAGFTPGLYVGWHAGLSAADLYRRLRFARYWSAYNLNRDQEPSVRGVQMRQGAGAPPHGVTFPIDTDVTAIDHKGDAPLVLVPDGWLV